MGPILSLAMVVKNEEQLLAGALEGMAGVVDEIVVVDTGSTDRTVEIALRSGARVVHHAWDGSLGRARNAYLDHATGTWVLVLDGDERIAASDRARLRPLLDGRGIDGYRFPVHNYTQSFDLLGDWHPNAGVYPEEERLSGCPGHSRFSVLRLFRRAPSVRYEEGFSAHTSPLASVLRMGGRLADTGVVIHHLQVLKGGEAFVADKQRQRMAGELRHLALYPDDFLATLNVGRTLFSLGRDAEALHYLDRAIALDGESGRAFFARGIVRVQTRRFRAAIRDLRIAVARQPDDADAWAVLGMAYHGAGRFARAERALTTALAHRPHHPLALNSLGVLCWDQGRRLEAERHFRHALEVLPGHPQASLNLSDLHEEQRAGVTERARSAASAPAAPPRTRARHAPPR